MSKGLQNAVPPRRRAAPQPENQPENQPEKPQEVIKAEVKASPVKSGTMFTQVAEGEKVQFNKRITRSAADVYEMLSIRTRKKVPELLEEAAELLQEKYGKV